MSDLLRIAALAVRAGRKRLVLSQRELAEQTGVGSGTVGRIETAQPGVSLAALERVLGTVGLRLAVVDEQGLLWNPERSALDSDLDGRRDRLGRRLPAHLFHTSHDTEMWWLGRQFRYPGRIRWDLIGYRLRSRAPDDE